LEYLQTGEDLGHLGIGEFENEWLRIILLAGRHYVAGHIIVKLRFIVIRQFLKNNLTVTILGPQTYCFSFIFVKNKMCLIAGFLMFGRVFFSSSPVKFYIGELQQIALSLAISDIIKFLRMALLR
jgi:hypothetical protein